MSWKQIYFQADWLLNDDFQIWLARVPEDNTKARCKLCKKSFGLSGKAALISHQTNSKKHLTYMKNMTAFLTSPKPKSSSGHKSSANTSKGNEGSKQQSTLEGIVNNSDKRKAEIIWALKSVCSGYSYNSSKDMFIPLSYYVS